jgi:uncharacterized membrane protein (UPF0127 family)
VLDENWRLLVSLLLFVILLGGILAVHDNQNRSKTVSNCGFRNDKTLTIGSKKIAAEVADTATARQKGLSGRSCISQNEGMLFVFGQPGTYGFWMKDMKFPIDMIWISSAHNAVVVEENVLPSTYPGSRFINPQDKPAQYVLELQAHASTKFNINPGTPINF